MKLLKKICGYILGYFIVTFIVFEVFTGTNLIDKPVYSKLAFTSYFLILSIYFLMKSIYNYKHDRPVKLSIIYKLFAVQMSLLDIYDPTIDFNFYSYSITNAENDATRKRVVQSMNKYINCKFNIIAYMINILLIVEILFYEQINNWILLSTLALYFFAYIYLFLSKKKITK